MKLATTAGALVASAVLAPLLVSASVQGDETEYECGTSDVFTYSGRMQTLVTAAQAADQQTTMDDLALHVHQLEERLRAWVTCDQEDCTTEYPTWDCTPFADADVDAGFYMGFPSPDVDAYEYVFVGTVVERGCTICLD